MTSYLTNVVKINGLELRVFFNQSKICTLLRKLDFCKGQRGRLRTGNYPYIFCSTFLSSLTDFLVCSVLVLADGATAAHTVSYKLLKNEFVIQFYHQYFILFYALESEVYDVYYVFCFTFLNALLPIRYRCCVTFYKCREYPVIKHHIIMVIM